MSIQRNLDPILFHRSAPMACPYLQGRLEQQLFTELSGPGAQAVFERLGEAGFRRSHHIMYRPVCTGCNSCVPVRIVASDFDFSRSWRRILNKNSDIEAEDVGGKVSEEQFDLFRRYVESRHGDGDMANMTARDYVNLVTASPVDTGLVEFRKPDGSLVAACLMDKLRDGFSAVYSFFDPDANHRSLGSYMILWLVMEARRLGLQHVYLGFWIADSHKMAYKRRFAPLEAFGPSGWRPVTIPEHRPE